MRFTAAMAAFAACFAPAAALAQRASEAPMAPSAASMPLLNETARIVDVVDSFDVGSDFSMRLTAGYQFTRRDVRIAREQGVSAGATSLGIPQTTDVVDSTHTSHTLLVGAEIGLYHDLALTFGLPFVLSDSRKLRTVGGISSATAAGILADGWTQGAMPGAATSLFNPNFDSPERSGIDQVHIGLMWSVFNQQRNRNRPTWTLAFEWRPPVGSQLRACQTVSASATMTAGTWCPDLASVPATPSSGTYAPTVASRTATTGNDPGISRGMHGIFFRTMVARRLGYLEPYAGLDVLAEFPIRSSNFHYVDTPFGQLSDFPPIVGTLTMGAEIIPWENRETWQRMVIDLRFRGQYFSPGRDYSPLFDALGTSASRPLLLPGCPANARQPDGSCQTERNVYFDGLTTNGSHVVLGGSATLTVQPAKFLRFTLGGGVAWTSSYLLTNTDACNPNTTAPTAHPEWQGGCSGASTPDPTHRPVVDMPGSRFRTTSDLNWDFYASIALTPRFW